MHRVILYRIARCIVQVYLEDAASYILQLTLRDLEGVVEISQRATEYNQYRIPVRDENKSREEQ